MCRKGIKTMNHLNSILTITAVSFITASSFGAEAPREVKSEFRQNIVKRDRLIRELAAVDAKAADAVAGGKEPLAMHAEQVDMQDQIDLLQLRLETMSVRWNMLISPPPTPGVDDMDESSIVTNKIQGAFQDGKDRTDRVLHDRCIQMLGSIDYSAFLAR